MQELDLQFTGLEPRPSSTKLSGNGRTFSNVVENVVPEAIDMPLRILVWMPVGSDTAALQAYGEYLTAVLDSQTTYRLGPESGSFSQLDRALHGTDLLLFGEPEQSFTERLLFGSTGNRVARKASSTILLARQPRHPLRKILLVVRVEAFEESAVAWAGCLAQASGAQLTILTLVPAQPAMYGPGSQLQIGIDSILAPNTRSGEQLRYFLNQLKEWHVDGRLRVRQGDPLWQICWEIDEGQHDLVIIGAEQHRQLERLLFGELVGPLLSRVNRPLLIAAAKQPAGLHPSRTRTEEPGVI